MKVRSASEICVLELVRENTEPGRLCGRNGSPVSESVSTMTEADKLEEIKQLVLANNQRVNDLIRKGSTKPLKSSRLDVQMRFNEEVVALLEDHADIPNVAEAMASLKARNSLLKKGDTRPEIFRFFDIHRESKPDIPYAACVHEALQDFAKVEATVPTSSHNPRVPVERKRA
ncbi:hypothetical protein QR680_012862 [Steinernema hermaphroditum]|uniref:Uncharacterized protein n=1 Tax=Steinernema hermaphroditum TaxID=289476 RepID=A0AA39I3J1_9BILA|nr:hypothetical protein QR680_012862 [Steinernema hermaphroditum]